MQSNGTIIEFLHIYKHDLEIKSQKFKKLHLNLNLKILQAQAVILSVSFNSECGQLFTISTLYRVGTLGLENYNNEVHMHIVSLAESNNILIGDLNFPEISRPDSTTSCELHRKCCDFFICDLGHTHKPTHKSGNTLDLLFSNIPGLIKTLKVLHRRKRSYEHVHFLPTPNCPFFIF